MLDIVVSQCYVINMENTMKTIIVIPGGFKPPHRGHIEMINHYAMDENIEKVIIFSGSTPRTSKDKGLVVSKQKSVELFNLFNLSDKVCFGKVAERISSTGVVYENPFMDAVDVLFDEKFSGKNIAIGFPTKEPSYADRYESIAMSIDKPMVANLVRMTPAETTDNLSATDLRNAVQDNDLEGLKRFVPDSIIEKYIKILIKK